jgi:hypothetical protein
LTTEEVAFLESFFEHFKERLSALSQKGHKEISSSLKKTKALLEDSRVVEYFRDLHQFVGIDTPVHFTALYVWWPDKELIRANPNGPFLLIRLRPHSGESINSADVVVHEAIHALFAAKANAAKKSLSEAILTANPKIVNHPSRLGIIEEPLATILGNIEFRKRFDPTRFQWARQWYGDPV